MPFLIAILCSIFLCAAPASAKKRLALLIGNQDYKLDSLDLSNPHNDVAAIGKALSRVGFEVRIVRDAGYGRLRKAVNRYAKRLQKAGNDAIGFFYYSGHGALNEANRFNYIIPADVDTIDSSDLWDGSVRLKSIVNTLKDDAPNAVHFVVFDACRNELKLSSKNAKSLRQSKGFKPIQETVKGMLIAYATAEGEIASDQGDDLGPYAEALADWITKPGVEAVSMFREVQVSVFNNIGQEPWYTHGALRRVYLAGQSAASQASTAEVARAWSQIEKSSKIELIQSFRDRYGAQHSFYDKLAKDRLTLLKEREVRKQKLKQLLKRKPGSSPPKQSAEAIYQEGRKYYFGKGVQKNYSKARQLFEQAAPHEHLNANYRLGLIYARGYGVEKNYSKAKAFLEIAASLGGKKSMYELGQLFYYGRGVDRDYVKAGEWYEKAALKGNTKAIYSLGFMFERGRGVAKDYNRARQLYQRAAEKKYHWAIYRLGYLHYRGRGVPKNYGRARSLFEKAASAGNKRAMKRLATMYRRGYGVPVDEAKAEQWSAKAQ